MNILFPIITGGQRLWKPTGTIAWFKADAITGMSDGQALSTWPDSSGNGYNATQGTSGKQPTYKVNILNGLPAVLFTASNNTRMATAGFTLNQPETVLVAANGTSNPNSWSADGLTNRMGMQYEATAFLLNAGSGGSQSVPGGTTGNSIAAGVFSGASSVNSWDGTATTVNPGTDNAGGVTIGDFYGGGQPWQGYIYEVIVYNTALSISDRQKGEGYLAWKWGIQSLLPAGHPYKNAPPFM